MLVHICCSVDSFYYLEKLRETFPEEPLTGYFYDPNIHPYSEYYLRMIDSKRSCDMLGVPFVEGPYDVEGWMNAVRGMEHLPEKGKRCQTCFDQRLLKTAEEAVARGEKRVTTTLLMSPKKDFSQLSASGKLLEEKYGVEFVALDFRKGGGTQAQFAMAREKQAYKQDYCGCLYALGKQRKQQERPSVELMSPVTGQVLPGSIEERVTLYEERMKLEEAGQAYEIRPERFLNYRLLWGKVTVGKTPVPSHLLTYSHPPGRVVKGKIIHRENGAGRLEKGGVILLETTAFNALARTGYGNVAELLKSPPTVETENRVRRELTGNDFDLSPIVVLDALPEETVAIELKAELFPDNRERLVSK